MTDETTIYDLMLLLSADAEEDRRAQITADVETMISRDSGSVVRRDHWGMRPLAYPIQHQGEADYHLIQFSGPPTLLETLNHTLSITDGVLRFRIIKVLPGTPPPPAPERVAATVAGAAAATSATHSSTQPDGDQGE